jgi:hypothetical protein
MHIHMAGGNHHDPLCRDELVGWVNEIRDQLGDPAFVAVEWGPGALGLIALARPSFRKLAGGVWGDGATEDLIGRLADTIGWEADAHCAVLPELPPVYLDPLRRRTNRALNAGLYAEIFWQRLREYPGDRGDVAATLAWIRTRSIEVAQADAYGLLEGRDLTREEAWRNRLAEQHPPDSGGWGLAVVGALHASSLDDDTFRRLLEAAGYPVTVRQLGWDPDI